MNDEHTLTARVLGDILSQGEYDKPRTYFITYYIYLNTNENLKEILYKNAMIGRCTVIY